VAALVLANPVLVAVVLFAAGDYRATFLERWILELYAPFMVPIACLVSGGSIIRDEVQAGTLPFLITRPMGRARLLLVRYLCQAVWLECALGMNAVLLTVVGLAYAVPEAEAMGFWLLLVQALLIPAFTAVSVLLGLISRRYLLLGVLYGFVVEVGIGQIPTNINTLSLSRHFLALLGGSPVYETGFGLSGWGAGGEVLAVVVLTGVALGAGAILFRQREYLASDSTPS